MFYVLFICFVLLIVVVWVHTRCTKHEPFDTALPIIDPDLVQNYQAFVGFYNPFLTHWQQAIVSAMTADQPQPPLTSPRQTVSSGGPPIPPLSDMNAYIANLSQQKGTSFPNMTEPLPATIDLNSFSTIAPTLPSDPAPFVHALTWMNDQLEEAHAKLQSALKGESFMNLEGFENQTCQDLSQCFNDNPQFAEQLEAALQAHHQKTQTQVSAQLQQFMGNSDLIRENERNQRLVEQSKQVQNQAQSGELLNQLNLPSEPETPYTLPKGSDKLQKMSFAQQKQVKDAAPAMYSLKTTLDQINANLH